MNTTQPSVPPRMRPHHKVRTGCLQCKNRRVKCTEEKPECARCVRYYESCTYNHTPSNNSEESFRTLSSPLELSPESSSLSLSDLELLHQWTTKSFRGFTETPSGDHDIEVWQNDIPKLGLKFPFLMRGVLASSALHLASEPGIEEGKKSHYLSVAARHQAAGLNGYRYILTERARAGGIDNSKVEDNSYAMITFGHLILTYSFVVPSCNSGVPEWISLIRGARKTLREIKLPGIEQHAHEAFVYESKRYLEILLDISNTSPTGVDTSFNKEDWVFIMLLLKVSSTSFLPPSEKTIYEEAITLLRRSYALHFQPPSVIPSPPPGMRFALSMWGEVMSEEFFLRLEERRPMALIVLAYLTPAIKRCEYCWYMKGEAERILGDVEKRLGEGEEEWRGWVDWPRSVITKIDKEKEDKERDRSAVMEVW